MLELVKHLDPVTGLWAGAAVAAVLFGRKAWPWLSRLKDFIDDLMGEPARPGVQARPGVMERLAAQEIETKRNRNELATVKALAESAEYHSRPNGGGSAYDHLMAEVRGLRQDFEIHRGEAKGRDDRLDTLDVALAHLSEALPVVARSVPHPVDAHLATSPDPSQEAP